MSSKQTFSERLRNFRERKGLTQKELGELLGVSANYVGMLEGGREVDQHSTLAKLFNLLDGARSVEPSAQILRAMQLENMSFSDLAARTGYAEKVLRAVIDERGGQASETMIEAICKVLPRLDKSELMRGSEKVPVISEIGHEAPYGSKVTIQLPYGSRARYVPLLSWAQAGDMVEWSDQAYTGEGVLAIDVADRKAFGLSVRGDSMSPKISEGDIAIVAPSWQPRSGDVVIARTMDGDVLCKIFQRREGGFTLSSYNPAYPPIELRLDQVAWVYPVAQVTKNMRTT